MGSLLRYEPAPYEHDAHWRFVESTWCWGAIRPPETIRRYIRRPEVTTLVAHAVGSPDDLMGWVCCIPTENAVVWAYAKDLPVIRRKGLASSLLFLAGVDVSQPTACLYWSHDATEVAKRDGYRIYFAPRTTSKRRAA